MTATTPARITSRAQLMEYVLGPQPKVAFFDCDGTLWDLDSGQDFFYWTLERDIFPAGVEQAARARYDAYLTGDVDEATMCGEMATLYAGHREEEIRGLAREFFQARVVPVIFSEMLELALRLGSVGCELWAVSSTNQWLVTEAVKYFEIPGERVLASLAKVVDGTITGELARVPSGHGKVLAIEAEHPGPVDVAFGNAIWDAEMLALARHPVVVNPNPDLEELAMQRGWPVYQPDRQGN